MVCVISGPPQRRSVHPDGQRDGRVPLRTAEASSVHDLRQEAAVYRGQTLVIIILNYFVNSLK